MEPCISLVTVQKQNEYLLCYLLEIARRGDYLPSTALQGLGNESSDLRKGNSHQSESIRKQTNEARKLGSCHPLVFKECHSATAGEHSNKWSSNRTHLFLKKVTDTTYSKHTWKSFLSWSILTRLCSYEGFGLWCSIDLVPKLTSYTLSMDFSTDTQQSTRLDTKEWKTHVVIRTWLCQLPSWAWTYGQVRKKVTDGKRGREKIKRYWLIHGWLKKLKLTISFLLKGALLWLLYRLNFGGLPPSPHKQGS